MRYQFNQKEYYLIITAQFPANGYNLIEDSITNNGVSATYSALNFLLVLNYKRTNSGGKEFTTYEVLISPKTKSVTPKAVAEQPSNKKKEFDENGNLIAEYTIKDGKREGPITYFNPDRTIKKEANIKHDTENGPPTVYDYDLKSKNLLAKTTGTMAGDKPEGITKTAKSSRNNISI